MILDKRLIISEMILLFSYLLFFYFLFFSITRGDCLVRFYFPAKKCSRYIQKEIKIDVLVLILSRAEVTRNKHTGTHISLSRLPINSIPFKQGTRRCIALPPAVRCGLSLIIHAFCFTGSTVDISLSVPQVERVALHKASDGRAAKQNWTRASLVIQIPTLSVLQYSNDSLSRGVKRL